MTHIQRSRDCSSPASGPQVARAMSGTTPALDQMNGPELREELALFGCQCGMSHSGYDEARVKHLPATAKTDYTVHPMSLSQRTPS